MNAITKLKVLIVGGILLGLASQVQATTIPLSVGNTQPYVVGYITPGQDFGAADIPGYVNTLIGLAPGGTTTMFYANHDNTWQRSNNLFPSLPQVDPTGSYPSQGNVTSFNIVSGNAYLLAKYDGPNAGLEVWYLGNLAGNTVTIPSTALGTLFGPNGGDQSYGLSGTWVLNGTPPSVPDGGLTVLLLGAALSGLGLLRRKLS